MISQGYLIDAEIHGSQVLITAQPFCLYKASSPFYKAFSFSRLITFSTVFKETDLFD
jgi:hypothetical protein